jgi:hypothetical protein
VGAALQGDSRQMDALRTPRRDLPLLGAGDTPQAGRPAGRAQHHRGTAQTGVWLRSAHSAVSNTPSLRETCWKGAYRDHYR